MLRRTLLATIAGAIPPFTPLEPPTAEPGKHPPAGPGADRETDRDDVPKDLPPRGPGTDTTAVVDRIVDDTAVVLFETEGFQRTVPATVLPENAREEGVVLRVPDGDGLALAEVDREATRERREDAQDRFDELSERPD